MTSITATAARKDLYNVIARVNEDCAPVAIAVIRNAMRKPNPAPQAILSAGLSRDLRLESASVSLGASSPSMNALISRNVTRSCSRLILSMRDVHTSDGIQNATNTSIPISAPVDICGMNDGSGSSA